MLLVRVLGDCREALLSLHLSPGHPGATSCPEVQLAACWKTTSRSLCSNGLNVGEDDILWKSCTLFKEAVCLVTGGGTMEQVS